jgi:integrase
MSKRRLNNEGSIYKRESDGRWVAEITVGRNPSDGKLIKKYFYGAKQSIVKTKMENYKKDLENQAKENNSQGDFTFGKWLNEWLSTYKRNNLKVRTFSDYDTMIRLYIAPRLGNISIKDITTKQLQDMYNELLSNGSIKTKGSLSIRTVKYVHTVCSLALEKASNLKMIPENVAVFTELPKNNKKEVEPLSLQEQMQFIKAIKSDKLECVFLLAMGTGLRIGEILALKWRNIDFGEGTLKVLETVQRVKNLKRKDENDTKTVIEFNSPKTSSSIRVVPIPSAILSKLQLHKERQTEEKSLAGSLYTDNDLVFATALGTVTEPRNVERIFYKLIKQSNLRHFNFHLMRHTFTTRLVEKNINFSVLQELLGHSKKGSVTFHYTHAPMSAKKEAIEQINYLFLEESLNSV